MSSKKLIFTKYSNERKMDFRIRTDIFEQEDGTRFVRKIPASPSAWAHVEKIFERYLWLKQDFSGTGLAVNHCESSAKGVRFPYLTGVTLEAELDALLAKGKMEELKLKIREFFSMFEKAEIPFVSSEGFQTVFGEAAFAETLYCRPVSDIDMIFSNAIRTEQGYELIDYEWTFDFAIPVKFIQYRCLYYYILGNAGRRDLLEKEDLYAAFGISKEDQEVFASMERSFQQYMLGDYIPNWKLYPEISQGVIQITGMAEKASSEKKKRNIEIYFDDGRGYGVWNCAQKKVQEAGVVTFRLQIPDQTRQVRFDPTSMPCVFRLLRLEQNGKALEWTSNGMQAENKDVIFDTEDPQVYFTPEGREPVEISFLAEPIEGLTRELLLHQQGRLSWIKGTRVWKLYQKVRKN